MSKPAHSNRLVGETSPYLLQHAHNPVDWYPWGSEALERARREDRPILLSIGYSACHWCHVMEHESFEDEAVARVMNEGFVCIKVDREERPDLDKIYQLAHQVLTQRAGGWPLTMFLSPDDQMPFFGGTYFPKAPRYGLPGFLELLQRVAQFFRQERDALRKQNASLAELFARIQPGAPAAGVQLSGEVLEHAYGELKRQFDARHGGFGAAPKFPHPPAIERCLRQWAQSALDGKPDPQALHMAVHTLQAMAEGGLYDQLGGGFCRYAVDQSWTIPHFEKMLYDNAQLLRLYVDAALATGGGLFPRVAAETAGWVMREMQDPEGGYYSTLDADSEGEEGKFYLWTHAALARALAPEELKAVEQRYGLQGEGNFEGQWHLNVRRSVPEVGDALGVPAARAAKLLEHARLKLLAERARRVRPGRDEKILTSWNALMIKGMARAGRLLGEAALIDSAERALAFITRRLWRGDRLLATIKDGRAHLNAYLDDYVFLADALLELLQARWRTAELELARSLVEVVLARFQAPGGGFYFTADDHERLVYRPIPTHDDAVPSGNGVAAHALLRLGHVLAEPRYLDAAERTLKALHGEIRNAPSANGSLLLALEEQLWPTQTIVLRGEPGALGPWVTRCNRHYAPRRLTIAIPDEVAALPGVLAERRATGKTTAYVCTGTSCLAPITELDELEGILRESEVPPPALSPSSAAGRG